MVILGIGSIFNVVLYTFLTKKDPKNFFDMVFKFFITITATEILTSMLSMPVMFYKHGLSGSVILTIAIAVTYKITANIIITFVYAMFAKNN